MLVDKLNRAREAGELVEAASDADSEQAPPDETPKLSVEG